jgi:hypothetical protein
MVVWTAGYLILTIPFHVIASVPPIYHRIAYGAHHIAVGYLAVENYVSATYESTVIKHIIQFITVEISLNYRYYQQITGNSL